MPPTTIEQAKADALERLFAIPGVTGVGIGPKVTGGRRTGEFSIVVYVSTKKPPDQIPAAELIPSEIDGHKTDVVKGGMAVRLNHVPLEPLLDKAQYPVLRGGVLISGGGNDGAGTLGCIAETTSSYVSGAGRIVLVTNHHVLFSSQPSDVTPHCNISVGQPTPSCCCPACDFWANIIAHIRANAVASSWVDGATAELKPGTAWRPEIQDEDGSGNPVPIPIAGVIATDLTKDDIKNGYPVWKRGAGTRKTTGNITAVAVSLNTANKPLSIVIEADQSCPYPTASDAGVLQNQSLFAYHGDSGSVMMNNSNQIVGLIWGGMNDSPQALACAIVHVQSELFIAIKTAANTPAGDQVVPTTNDAPVKPQAKLPLDDRNTYGLSNTAFFRGHSGADSRLQALLRTPSGQDYLSLTLRHQDELLRLVNTNRRVATVWHRNGGPSILQSFTYLHDDLRLPDVIDGQPLCVRLQRIAAIFERYGSNQLRADIAIWGPKIFALAHCSLKEIIDSFAEDCAHAG